MLSKSELVSKLNSIVESAKLSKSAKSEFDNLLQELTTRKAREVKHADYYSDENQCLMRFCKYHQRFERDDEMIAKKSYCRAASFISNQRRSEVKRLENDLLNLIQTNADASEISKLADIIKEKKALMHDSTTYDYEKDKIYYLENCKQRNKSDDKE
jgi:hypothetical protein